MIFKIKKYKHRHSNFIFPTERITWKNKVDFVFRFLSDPSYIVSNKSDQKDTNKIFGISDGWHHRIHSIRIGWRHNPDIRQTTYCVYYYVDGKHYVEDLGPLRVNQDIYIRIEIEKGFYIVKTSEKVVKIERTSKWFGPRYYLYPYFGGQQVAPKQFKIKLNIW